MISPALSNMNVTWDLGKFSLFVKICEVNSSKRPCPLDPPLSAHSPRITSLVSDTVPSGATTWRWLTTVERE